MSLSNDKKKELVNKYGENDVDTGKTEVQVALLSERIKYLTEHFNIPSGIVINKFDLKESFCKEIEYFAKDKNIPILGRIPYKKDFVEATINMEPVVENNENYRKIFNDIIKHITIHLNNDED